MIRRFHVAEQHGVINAVDEERGEGDHEDILGEFERFLQHHAEESVALMVAVDACEE